MRSLASLGWLASLSLVVACSAAGTDDGAAASAAVTQPSADPTYGPGGVLRIATVEPESTSALAYDDEGRLVLLSGQYDDRGLLRAERRLANGHPDASFGHAKLPVLVAPEGGALELQPLPDASLVVAASALCALSTCPYDDDAPGKVRRFVFRLSPSGALDESFGGGKGHVELPSPPRDGALASYPMHLARTPKGEIVVAHDGPNDEVAVLWLDAQGRKLDERTIHGVSGETRSVAATNDLVFVGRTGGRGESFATITAVERATGKTRRGAAEWRAQDFPLALLTHLVVSDGAVWAAGNERHEGDYGPSRAVVHKLGLDLLPDPSFGAGGTKVFNLGTGQGGEVRRIGVLGDGRIVVAGTIDAAGAFAHDAPLPKQDRDLGFVVLQPNGAYDTSVAERGTVMMHVGTDRDEVTTLSIGPRGVFAAGFAGRTPVATKLLLSSRGSVPGAP